MWSFGTAEVNNHVFCLVDVQGEIVGITPGYELVQLVPVLPLNPTVNLMMLLLWCFAMQS